MHNQYYCNISFTVDIIITVQILQYNHNVAMHTTFVNFYTQWTSMKSKCLIGNPTDDKSTKPVGFSMMMWTYNMPFHDLEVCVGNMSFRTVNR